MQPLVSTDARSAGFTKVIESEQDISALQQHLKEVVEGAAFKGSHRSGQFLSYIVEQAIAGHFDSLKERVIGVELFGRSPSYDTGDDAIVRVTASDVRRRLLQHYGMCGATSRFRINLPLGSYIPEIIPELPNGNHNGNHNHNHHEEAAEAAADAVSHETALPSEAATHPAQDHGLAVVPQAPAVTEVETKPRGGRRWMIAGVVLTTLNVLIWAGALIAHYVHRNAPAATVPLWSAMFSSPHAVRLITSDPNIVEIQDFTGGQITVSDYANHNYIPDPNALSPEILRFCRSILRGDKSADVDTPIAVNIAQMAQSASKRIHVRAARNLQLAELKTDDNFILLGSPRSDPWSGLFADQLDFRFIYDKATQQEILHNVRPRPKESAYYVPTALGWATGQSYAIVAFVRNPDQTGNVLLLSGANGEGTEAAGRLATDLPRMTTVLNNCGISSDRAIPHFELLLRLNMMAGSPSNIDVVACHILQEGTEN